MYDPFSDEQDALTFGPLAPTKPRSYSAIKLYEKCPLAYKLAYMEKLPDPSGEAAQRGKLIHSQIEDYINNVITELPHEQRVMQVVLDFWKARKAKSEVQFAVDRVFKPVKYDDPKAMFRGVIDLLIIEGKIAHVIDFKTGKKRDYSDQLTVYAAAVFALYPKIQTIERSIYFVDLDLPEHYTPVERSDTHSSVSLITERIAKLEKDSIFSPNPSSLCRFCNFKKDAGGPCKW